MSFAAIGVSISALSLGFGVASSANQGKGVTLDNGAGIKAEAETLPYQRQLDAAMQQGTKVSIPTGRMTTQQVEQQMVRLTRGGRMVGAVEYKPEDWQEGGKYYQPNQTPPTPYTVKVNQRVPEVIEADFTGYGDADIQAKLADQMAQIQLELGEKYGLAFIEEAKKQLALADPEGVAAREKLFELTQQQADRQPVSPVATLLHQRIGEELAAGNRLTERAAGQLDTAATGAGTVRGGKLNQTLLRREMESGREGDARKTRTIQKGLGWLSSGATPEDVKYRSTQQNLANLSNFTQGRTPTSQFSSLSNAQRGATPFVPSQPGPQLNPGVTQSYNQVALGGWGTQLQNKAASANPWMAGLSTLLSGANAVMAGKN